jgi:hypothetical protein
LLVEPAATNLLLRSEEFDNASWSKIDGSVTANAAISPDGTMTADLLLDDASDGNIRQIVTTTATTHTQSIYCKPFGRSGFLVWNSVGYVDFDFNLVAIIDNANATGTITAVGNGWFRLTCTFSASAGTPNINFTNRGTGRVDGVSGVYIWAAQLETGSVATSYIPTTSATATRNADVISKTGVSGFIGQSQGSVYAEVDIKQLPASSARTFIDVGSSGNRIFMGFTSLTSNTLRLQIDAGVGGNACVDIRAVVANAGIIKVAVAYQSLNCALYVNGVQATNIQSNIDFSFTTALSALFLGSTVSASAFVNDRIRAAAIYTTRLEDDELIALTTL